MLSPRNARNSVSHVVTSCKSFPSVKVLNPLAIWESDLEEMQEKIILSRPTMNYVAMKNGYWGASKFPRSSSELRYLALIIRFMWQASAKCQWPSMAKEAEEAEEALKTKKKEWAPVERHGPTIQPHRSTDSKSAGYIII